MSKYLVPWPWRDVCRWTSGKYLSRWDTAPPSYL